ncbi:MAG: DHA2 family efflux MFS transporter permease subunit [Rhodospirillales bacterium]|jgi:DHA2 family multidrug resistance protein|nr:DHA2 family efflux MFS transporter permease subunit [Rhodospirillales bacterium]
MSSQPLLEVPNRGLITICLMVATLMQALDSTIAVVSLPYMQGGLAASSEQIDWVLTSFVIGAAVMTAPSGWLASRFGRKNVLMTSLIGFTVTSMLCGLSTSLTEIVAFRFLQGLFGSQLVPLSQSTMIDIYPEEKRGQAMAIWGLGVMVGPILGPTLGGYLTDFYNWRYIFFVNLPFGVLGTIGIAALMPRRTHRPKMTFDWFGFGLLAMALVGLQLMLDRGQEKDWLSSPEILIEAVIAGFGFYFFVVHLVTTSRQPFLQLALFRDVNITSAMVTMLGVGAIILASSALLAPYLQDLADYPVRTAGLVMAPRGFGTMAAMWLAGRLSARVDPRKLMTFGVAVVSYSLYRMMNWLPDVAVAEVVTTIVLQGFGLGFVFIPLQVAAYATLRPDLRGEAAGMLNLCRNVGSAVGTSITAALLVRNEQTEHSVLSQFASPLNRALDGTPAVHRYLDLLTHGGAALLNHMIDAQSAIIAYSDDYKFLMLMTLPLLILFFIMRRPRQSGGPREAAVMD